MSRMGSASESSLRGPDLLFPRPATALQRATEACPNRKGETTLFADEIGVDTGLGPASLRHPLGNAMPLEAVLFTEERE